MNKDNAFLFGDINLDVSMLVPEIPPPGQDAYVDQLVVNVGGSATNTSIVLSQLGLMPRLFGSIGTDPNGDYLLNALKTHHLDTSYIQRKKDIPSGQIFLTILPDGERTMYSFRGANVLTSPEDIPSDWLLSADLLHISGYTFLKNPQRATALRLIEIAKSKNIPVSMDTGMDPVLHAHAEMKPALQCLDICICGQREGALLTGCEKDEAIIHALFDLGIHCAAIKLGTQGCLVGLNGELFRLPALSIHVVDTTGSGDAFSAGILLSWLHQFSLSSMCMLANSLGAYAASQLGPVTPQLNWKVLTNFLVNIRSAQTPELQQSIDHLIQKLKETEIES